MGRPDAATRLGPAGGSPLSSRDLRDGSGTTGRQGTAATDDTDDTDGPDTDHRADGAYGLSPRVDVVVYSEDEVRIRQGTWADWTLTLHDDERRGVVGRIFTEMLGGAATPGDLLARPGIDGRVERDDLVAFLADLRQSGIVLIATDPSPMAAPPRHNGQHGQHGQRVPSIGPAEPGPRRRTAHVAVVGDGPTSVLLTSYLTEAGAGVAPVALLDTAGAAVTAPHGTAGAPRDAIEAACDGTDFLVVAVESLSPTLLTAANSVALDRGIPWAATYADGSLVVVGPIYVPGETGCFAEFEAQLLSVCPKPVEMKAQWDALDRRTPPRRAPRWQGGIAAGWLVEPLVEFLDTGASDLVGVATVFDVAQRRVEKVRCLTLPRCPVCRSDRGGYNPWD